MSSPFFQRSSSLIELCDAGDSSVDRNHVTSKSPPNNASSRSPSQLHPSFAASPFVSTIAAPASSEVHHHHHHQNHTHHSRNIAGTTSSGDEYKTSSSSAVASGSTSPRGGTLTVPRALHLAASAAAAAAPLLLQQAVANHKHQLFAASSRTAGNGVMNSPSPGGGSGGGGAANVPLSIGYLVKQLLGADAARRLRGGGEDQQQQQQPQHSVSSAQLASKMMVDHLISLSNKRGSKGQQQGEQSQQQQQQQQQQPRYDTDKYSDPDSLSNSLSVGKAAGTMRGLGLPRNLSSSSVGHLRVASEDHDDDDHDSLRQIPSCGSGFGSVAGGGGGGGRETSPSSPSDERISVSVCETFLLELLSLVGSTSPTSANMHHHHQHHPSYSFQRGSDASSAHSPSMSIVASNSGVQKLEHRQTSGGATAVVAESDSSSQNASTTSAPSARSASVGSRRVSHELLLHSGTEHPTAAMAMSQLSSAPDGHHPSAAITLVHLHQHQQQQQQQPQQVLHTSKLEEQVFSDGVRQLNNYILLMQIGQGAQSVVHLAIDSVSSDTRAIKEIPRSAPGQGIRSQVEARRSKRRLQREIHIMKRCIHRNLVTLFEVIDDAETSDSIFLVMKLFEHGPIARLDDAGRCSRVFSVKRVVKYMAGLTSALKLLHAKRVVHGDIKIDQILVGQDDEVALADFGISRIFPPLSQSALASRPSMRMMMMRSGRGSVADLTSLSSVPPSQAVSRRASFIADGPAHYDSARFLDRIGGAAAFRPPESHLDNSGTPQASRSPELGYLSRHHSGGAAAAAASSSASSHFNSNNNSAHNSSGSNGHIKYSNNNNTNNSGGGGNLQVGMMTSTPPKQFLVTPVDDQHPAVTLDAPANQEGESEAKAVNPHQFEGLCAADVWALGLCAYLMLYGRLPWSSAGGIVEYINALTSSEPVQLPARAMHESEEIERCVLDALGAMLCKQPQRRCTAARAAAMWGEIHEANVVEADKMADEDFFQGMSTADFDTIMADSVDSLPSPDKLGATGNGGGSSFSPDHSPANRKDSTMTKSFANDDDDRDNNQNHNHDDDHQSSISGASLLGEDDEQFLAPPNKGRRKHTLAAPPNNNDFGGNTTAPGSCKLNDEQAWF